MVRDCRSKPCKVRGGGMAMLTPGHMKNLLASNRLKSVEIYIRFTDFNSSNQGQPKRSAITQESLGMLRRIVLKA